MTSETNLLSQEVFDPAEAGWTRRRSNPFFDLIGPFWQRQEEDGRFIFAMHCTPNTLNNSGNMHGGAVTAFCDQALGGTLIETLSRVEGQVGPVRSVTVQLNVQFLAAVKPGDFMIARCRVTRHTRTLVFVDGLVEVDGEAVAALQSVFKLVKPAA